jgi:hypothetical protein
MLARALRVVFTPEIASAAATARNVVMPDLTIWSLTGRMFSARWQAFFDRAAHAGSAETGTDPIVCSARKRDLRAPVNARGRGNERRFARKTVDAAAQPAVAGRGSYAAPRRAVVQP